MQFHFECFGFTLRHSSVNHGHDRGFGCSICSEGSRAWLASGATSTPPRQGRYKFVAFALPTPGASPPDDSLKGLLHGDPDQVGVGQLASICRPMFDAQTLSAAQVILAGNEATKGGRRGPMPSLFCTAKNPRCGSHHPTPVCQSFYRTAASASSASCTSSPARPRVGTLRLATVSW